MITSNIKNFNLKFLIADDDIRVCQAIKTRLSHYNCDVITASDGEEPDYQNLQLILVQSSK